MKDIVELAVNTWVRKALAHLSAGVSRVVYQISSESKELSGDGLVGFNATGVVVEYRYEDDEDEDDDDGHAC